MIPGPFSICHVTFPDQQSDAPVFQTLSYGYDTGQSAHDQLEKIAQEAGVPIDECTVIQIVDK